MSMVSECIVVQRGDKIVGLVYPDFDEAKEMGFSQSDLQEIMEQSLCNHYKLPSDHIPLLHNHWSQGN